MKASPERPLVLAPGKETRSKTGRDNLPLDVAVVLAGLETVRRRPRSADGHSLAAYAVHAARPAVG